jgi:hypothetical protein
MKNDKGRPLDGHSLKTLLNQPENTAWGGPNAAMTALYKWAKYYDPEKQSYSLRYRDWRYVRYENGKEELYHCAEDPYEWTNLALNPEYAPKLKSCREDLLARIPDSKPPPKPAKLSGEAWKDSYFKKFPAADADGDGKLSWPEYKMHKAKNTK